MHLSKVTHLLSDLKVNYDQSLDLVHFLSGKASPCFCFNSQYTKKSEALDQLNEDMYKSPQVEL